MSIQIRIMGQRQGGRAGFTLLEMILGATILALLAKTMISATTSVSRLTESGNLESRIQRDSDRAMARIMEDLRMSGFHTVNEREYPHIFADGQPASDFGDFEHTSAPQAATPGEADYGPMCSIILCAPSDLDGNGRHLRHDPRRHEDRADQRQGRRCLLVLLSRRPAAALDERSGGAGLFGA